MNATDPIRDAVLDVMHARPADRPVPDRPGECCERCGVDDGDPLVVMIHPGNRGTIRAHLDCGAAAGYRLVTR